MRRRRVVLNGLSAMVVCGLLGGCASMSIPVATTGPPAATPSASETSPAPARPPEDLAEFTADGVTVQAPRDWQESEPIGGPSLQVSDPAGDSDLTVLVVEAVRNTIGDTPYDAASYLGIALGRHLESLGIQVTGEFGGSVQVVDVAGAENGARLDIRGQRDGKPVACHLVAGQVGVLIAIVVTSQPADVADSGWEAVVRSVRIDAETLEAS